LADVIGLHKAHVLGSFKVVESNTLQILQNGKILKLLKATVDDAGQYSCKAINVAGSSEKLFNLYILG